MATTNLTVTAAWTVVCDDTQDFLLTLPTPGAEIELATTANGDDPTVAVGHRLVYGREVGKENLLTRTLIGPGHVFARAISPASLAVALNLWYGTGRLLPDPTSLPDGTMMQVVDGVWTLII